MENLNSSRKRKRVNGLGLRELHGGVAKGDGELQAKRRPPWVSVGGADLRHTFKTWLGKNQGACMNQVPSIPPKHVIESAP